MKTELAKTDKEYLDKIFDAWDGFCRLVDSGNDFFDVFIAKDNEDTADFAVPGYHYTSGSSGILIKSRYDVKTNKRELSAIGDGDRV